MISPFGFDVSIFKKISTGFRSVDCFLGLYFLWTSYIADEKHQWLFAGMGISFVILSLCRSYESVEKAETLSSLQHKELIALSLFSFVVGLFMTWIANYKQGDIKLITVCLYPIFAGLVGFAKSYQLRPTKKEDVKDSFTEPDTNKMSL